MLGVAAVLLGVVLVVRPFSSLAVLVVVVVAGLVVLGVDELADGDRWSVLRGSVSLAAAVAVVAWPGVTIRVLAVLVAVALVLDGVLDVARARGVHGTARANAVVGGATAIVLGLLAFVWPDVTVLVVAVVFAVRLVVVGVREIVAGVRGQDADLGRLWPRRGAPQSGWWRLTGVVLGALVALILVVAGVVVQRGTPRPDAFYDPPAHVPSAPGQLLRSEPFTSDEIPAGARAWRILYTTTRDAGRPAVASGLVVTPVSGGPSPVVAWAHGTTGAASGCAPTVLPDGLAAGAMFVQDDVLAQGWAMVATDYTGLGTAGPHPYLIGQGEGRSVLDAVRAAHQLADADLADETVVWGHSQGGHAALWAGVLAPSYAPELQIDGIAALAPASNLPALVDVVGSVTGGALFASYVVEAYTAEYPDLAFDDLVRPGARIIVRETAQRCLAEPGVLVSVLTSVALDKPIWSGDPSSGAFLDRLNQNVPSGPIEAPLLVGQGADDALVTPAAQGAYVDARCAAGYPVDYRSYAGRGHVPLVEADSPLIPELVGWSRGPLRRGAGHRHLPLTGGPRRATAHRPTVGPPARPMGRSGRGTSADPRGHRAEQARSTPTRSRPRSPLVPRHAWRIPAGLVLLSLVPVLAGGMRLAELSSDPEVTAANERFVTMPLPVVLHIVGATVFCLLGAFQFHPGLRRRRPRWHRVAGRVVAPAGVVAALAGLWMAVFTDLPAGDGPLLEVFRLVFGTGMVAALVLGVVAIRRGDVVTHSAWVTRGYAIGQGAGRRR